MELCSRFQTVVSNVACLTRLLCVCLEPGAGQAYLAHLAEVTQQGRGRVVTQNLCVGPTAQGGARSHGPGMLSALPA